MPTGYTSDIYNGKPQTFKEFAMECARAFGALITLRDSPDEPIPEEFTPRTEYYYKQLEEATRRLPIVGAWTPEEAQAAADAAYERIKAAHDERVNEVRELGLRYDNMLRSACAYVPPSPDHEEFRKFMIQQLENSKKSDCYTGDPLEPFDPSEYKASQIDDLERQINRCRKNIAEENQRAADRTRWVTELRESLK